MDKIKFTPMEDLPVIEEGFLYLAIVVNINHEVGDYEMLHHKNGEFLIWCGVEVDYIDMNDDDVIKSIAKLSEYGSTEF